MKRICAWRKRKKCIDQKTVRVAFYDHVKPGKCFIKRKAASLYEPSFVFSYELTWLLVLMSLTKACLALLLSSIGPTAAADFLSILETVDDDGQKVVS